MDEFFDVEVIASSRHALSGSAPDIVTLRLTYPRMIHAEFMTHRAFSRNASSSRAIPTKRLLQQPCYVPAFHGNRPGMQAADPLPEEDFNRAVSLWEAAAGVCRNTAEDLLDLGVHKQWANRMLEWFGQITVLVTATDWKNFLYLRDDSAAQPEFQHLAKMIATALEEAKDVAQSRTHDQWHLPFVPDDELHSIAQVAEDLRWNLDGVRHIFAELEISGAEKLALICSVARCARVSYNTHSGKKPTALGDFGTFEKLLNAGGPLHASPFEHQARPSALLGFGSRGLWGNFRMWQQFRKYVPRECVR